MVRPSPFARFLTAAYDCRKIAWLLKKSLFFKDDPKLGDRKCLGDPRKSFIGHPDAISFLRISRKRVFQHPLAIAQVTEPGVPFRGSLRYRLWRMVQTQDSLR